jgi:hypothetical protein
MAIIMLYIFSAIMIYLISNFVIKISRRSKCRCVTYKVVHKHTDKTKHYKITVERRKCKCCGKEKLVTVERKTF